MPILSAFPLAFRDARYLVSITWIALPPFPIHILGLPCLEVTPLVSLTPFECSRSHRITVHLSTHGRYNGLISKLTVWCILAFFLANGNGLEYLTRGDIEYERCGGDRKWCYERWR